MIKIKGIKIFILSWTLASSRGNLSIRNPQLKHLFAHHSKIQLIFSLSLQRICVLYMIIRVKSDMSNIYIEGNLVKSPTGKKVSRRLFQLVIML